MDKQVICEHPVIIVNPLLRDYILKFHNVTIKGKRYDFSPDRLDLYFLPPCVIKPYRRVSGFSWPTDVRSLDPCSDNPFDSSVDVLPSFDVGGYQQIFHDDLDSSYVVDDNGETLPVYLEVPCGKCDLCKNAKINSFVERCKMESQCYNSKPWFVTLTYDNDHLPLTGVSIRALQLFLKRFRINLIRAGYDFKLRYAAVGEYGKGNPDHPERSMINGYHRPHYHLIIWGLDVFDHFDFDKVSDIMLSSWDQGNIKHRVIEPGDDKPFFYTAKYLLKDNFIPTYVAPDGIEQSCNPFFFFSPGTTVD